MLDKKPKIPPGSVVFVLDEIVRGYIVRYDDIALPPELRANKPRPADIADMIKSGRIPGRSVTPSHVTDILSWGYLVGEIYMPGFRGELTYPWRGPDDMKQPAKETYDGQSILVFRCDVPARELSPEQTRDYAVQSARGAFHRFLPNDFDYAGNLAVYRPAD